jgi:hypothetical protein
LENDFTLLNEFYSFNEKRNRFFLDTLTTQEQGIDSHSFTPCNIEKTDDAARELLTKSKRIIVMVSGGFHSNGITQLLNERGISHITITPAITKETDTATQIYEAIIHRQVKALQRKEHPDVMTKHSFLTNTSQSALADVLLTMYRTINNNDELTFEEDNKAIIKQVVGILFSINKNTDLEAALNYDNNGACRASLSRLIGRNIQYITVVRTKKTIQFLFQIDKTRPQMLTINIHMINTNISNMINTNISKLYSGLSSIATNLLKHPTENSWSIINDSPINNTLLSSRPFLNSIKEIAKMIDLCDTHFDPNHPIIKNVLVRLEIFGENIDLSRPDSCVMKIKKMQMKIMEDNIKEFYSALKEEFNSEYDHIINRGKRSLNDIISLITDITFNKDAKAEIISEFSQSINCLVSNKNPFSSLSLRQRYGTTCAVNETVARAIFGLLTADLSDKQSLEKLIFDHFHPTSATIAIIKELQKQGNKHNRLIYFILKWFSVHDNWLKELMQDKDIQIEYRLYAMNLCVSQIEIPSQGDTPAFETEVLHLRNIFHDNAASREIDAYLNRIQNPQWQIHLNRLVNDILLQDEEAKSIVTAMFLKHDTAIFNSMNNKDFVKLRKIIAKTRIRGYYDNAGIPMIIVGYYDIEDVTMISGGKYIIRSPNDLIDAVSHELGHIYKYIIYNFSDTDSFLSGISEAVGDAFIFATYAILQIDTAVLEQKLKEHLDFLNTCIAEENYERHVIGRSFLYYINKALKKEPATAWIKAAFAACHHLKDFQRAASIQAYASALLFDSLGKQTSIFLPHELVSVSIMEHETELYFTDYDMYMAYIHDMTAMTDTTDMYDMTASI